MNVSVWNSTKKMILALLLLCMAMPFFSSCTDDDEYTVGVWYSRADLNGKPRTDASGFTIGNKGYICTGYKSKSSTDGEQRLNDLWEYDMDDNYWTQCADMPSAAGYRSQAVGFAIGTKGYITTGMNSSNTYLADTWEYDPDTNTWTQKDDFMGGPRCGTLAFTIGTYGYVGTGYDDSWWNDFYRFNPDAASGSQWEAVKGFGGKKRQNGTAFVIDDKAYICAGTSNGSYPYDLWCFDPSSSTPFTQMRDIADTNDDEDYDDDYGGIVRASAVSFVIDGKGYLVTGESGGLKTDYWVYDPSTDLWIGGTPDDYTPFALLNSGSQGSSRKNAVSFSNGKRGFVVSGTTGSYYLDDMYELSPYENRDE